MIYRLVGGIALFGVTSAAAQPQPAAPAPEAITELRCAMWAAQIAGETKDPQMQQSFGYALSYFIGRFEGMTGRDFDEVATLEFTIEVAENIESLSQPCGMKMQAMGDRMVSWGNKVQAKAEALE